MKKLFSLCIKALSLLVLFLSTHAYSQSNQLAVKLKSEDVIPQKNIKEIINENWYVSSGPNSIYIILQFDKIPDNQEKKNLKASGIDLLSYIPEKAYFARISTPLPANFFSKPQNILYIPIEERYKLHPSILMDEIPQYAISDDGRIDVVISFFRDQDPAQYLNTLKEYGALLFFDEFASYLSLRISSKDIYALAGLDFISFIEPAFPPPEPENYTGRTLHRSNILSSLYNGAPGYTGRNVAIMLQDDGIIGPHIDYSGRVGAQFISYDYGDHGDHVAGIIMGAGNLDPRQKGMAYGSTLYVYGAAPVYPGFNVIPTHYYDPGIRITSTSYGDGCNNGYTSLTRALDLQIITYPSLMHVFSAGNSGYDDCGYGAGPGWGNVTGGHKVGKNVIAVANLDYIDQLSGSSSRGPAHDGRIKPDISAKGSDVYSTTNPNEYTYKSGTSMSCPGVSGTLAQLYEAYSENNAGYPKAGLIKSLLLNGADDLGKPGPDFKYGWGRINAFNTLKMIEQYTYDSASLNQNELFEHQIQIPEGLKQAKFMIYWTDYPANVNTSKALVNNLDMTIETPDGTVHYPLVLNSAPDPLTLDEPASEGIDNLNNMEQIVLDNPEAGTYFIKISGTEIPEGPQQYYLNWLLVNDDIFITYPFGGESLVPGEEEVIRWDAPGNEGLFSLEFSIDGGQSWEFIEEEISASARYYEWVVPANITPQAIIRLSRDDKDNSSGSFSIMNTVNDITVNWSCQDKFHIEWEEVFGASEYEVFLLGEKYMQSLGLTNQNTFIIEGVNAAIEDWVSIKAISPEGAISKRSLASLKNPGVYNCHEKDMKLESVITAERAYYHLCQSNESIPVSIRVKNWGTNSFSNFTLGYNFNDGPDYTEFIETEVAADSTYEHTFEIPIMPPDTGSFSLKTWITSPEDEKPENDSLLTELTFIDGIILEPPFTYTFDNLEECLPYPTCSDVLCPLGDGFINAKNILHDDIDWRTYSGSTISNGTGPDADHTTGSDEGNYLYLEPSVVCFNKEAELISPCIDLTSAQNPYLSLWYHAMGEDIGRLHLDVLLREQTIKDIIPPIIGPQGDDWQELQLDLSPFTGQVINLRITGWTGYGQKGDLAIDDLSVTELTSSNTISKKEKILIFPNPSTDYLFIESADNENIKMIQVFDPQGRLIQKFVPSKKDKKIMLDIQKLAKGMYFMKAYSETGSSFLKFNKI